MPSTKTILLAAICALTASATPVPRAAGVTADMLLQIDQSMATCAAGNDECATAAQAAPALSNAFAKYKITDPKQQAALVAYMYFESGHFVYNRNQFPAPGRPGQGTRMMAMPPFVAKYAAAAADPAELQAAMQKTGDDQLNAILATVNKNNDLSFGSAVWFLSTQCSDDVKAGLSAGSLDGWHNFLTTCVGTTADPARDPSYLAAIKAIGQDSPAAPSQPQPAQSSSPQPQPAQPSSSQPQPTQPSSPQPQPTQPSSPQPQPTQPSSPQPQPSKPSTPQPEPAKPSSTQPQPTQPSSPYVPAPAMPSGTGTTSPSSPPSGNSGNTCTKDGAVVCNGEKQFGLCNRGQVIWQDVAAGTSCINGVVSKRSFNSRIART